MRTRCGCRYCHYASPRTDPISRRHSHERLHHKSNRATANGRESVLWSTAPITEKEETGRRRGTVYGYVNATLIQMFRESTDAASMIGLDALPPGVNVTIFQQTNATYQTDAMAEAASCPWQAVMNGLPISSCQEV